ncbi:uncharacterized protein LOC117342905 [Pecten maximus]|uniref:uncharacterized protein LOC117342905 n=1 Tax=Pecten maximus TaxID=6579 RepID=UPI001457EAE9|nr:uncharacterized protein LOC117342905 [Pecten maximus]
MVAEQMRPSDIRFTHDSVSCRFSDGHTLEETFKDLLYDDVTLPPLVVMHYSGYWFVVRGNRRLYLLKKLEDIGKIQQVTVIKRAFQDHLFYKQFTTKNMGISIRIRGNRFIEGTLRQCINDWRYSKTRPSSSIFTGDFMDSSISSSSSSSMDNWMDSYTRPSSSSISMYGSGSIPRHSFSNYSPPSRTPPVRSYTPLPSPPPAKKDDSWCTIL